MANKKCQAALFAEGDLVYLLTENMRILKGCTWKLSPKFIGPYKILKDYGNNSFNLDLLPELKQREIHPSLYASLLCVLLDLATLEVTAVDSSTVKVIAPPRVLLAAAAPFSRTDVLPDAGDEPGNGTTDTTDANANANAESKSAEDEDEEVVVVKPGPTLVVPRDTKWKTELSGLSDVAI